MSVTDVLPLLIPICGSILAFSVSIHCCLRRKMRGEYNSLEYRVRCLEQQITSKPTEPPVTSQQYTPTNYNQYPNYSQYPQPTAPNNIIYGAPPPTNPYVYTI
jgi:hypothetical protein